MHVSSVCRLCDALMRVYFDKTVEARGYNYVNFPEI